MKDFLKNNFHPTEMYKLINMLVKFKIPFEEVQEIYDTPQIWYPSYKDHKCDVICHAGSWGHEEGLLEMMGLIENDDVCGYLSANEVFCLIQKDYENIKRSLRD